MIKFINGWTGTDMWVAETRVEEYIAAGHKLAADPPEVPTVTEKPKLKPEAKAVVEPKKAEAKKPAAKAPAKKAPAKKK